MNVFRMKKTSREIVAVEDEHRFFSYEEWISIFNFIIVVLCC